MINISTSAHFNNKATLLVWNFLGFKQVKLVSQLCNSKEPICDITNGCGKKPVLVLNGNLSNFSMDLERHHLKWYAELTDLKAQERGQLYTTWVICIVILLYIVLYHHKNFCSSQLNSPHPFFSYTATYIHFGNLLNYFSNPSLGVITV